MRPRRLLVISMHAPPGREVGGLRWWGLSKYLVRMGWHVHLVTAQAGADREAVPDGMTVEVVRLRTTLNDRYRSWKDAGGNEHGSRGTERGESEEGAESGTGDEGPNGGVLRALLREVGGLLSFPDHGRGWIRPLVRAVRARLHSDPPDAVVSSGPPHSVHLAAGLVLHSRPIPWFVDFRDPWSDEGPLHNGVQWTDPVLARLEASVMRRADRVLTTTPELASTYRKRYPGLLAECLYNGVDGEDLPARIDDPDDPFTVIHLGTLYMGRDPEPVIRGFGEFLRRRPEACGAGARLCLVGRILHDYRGRAESVAEEEGIAGTVKTMPPCARSEALKLLARSHVALVLAQNQSTAIPAKIYESVAMGVPTLVVTEEGSASEGAANRLGQRSCEPLDREAIANAFADAWDGSWSGGIPASARVRYRDLAVELKRVLETVTKSVPGPAVPVGYEGSTAGEEP